MKEQPYKDQSYNFMFYKNHAQHIARYCDF